MFDLISGIVLCLIVRGKKADRVESIYSKGCNMTQGWPDSNGHDDYDNASKQKTPWRVSWSFDDDDEGDDEDGDQDDDDDDVDADEVTQVWR